MKNAKKIGIPFEKGNKGKPKGAVNKVTQQARELFVEFMEGEVDNVKNSFAIVRETDHSKYLDLMAKYFPYFIPKKAELDHTNKGNAFEAPIINVLPKSDAI
jgi:hypothetical protein